MLDVKGVTKTYGSGDARVVALNNVSFRVNNGDFIAIMGPSGSGKSTLLNVIGGLDSLSAGEVVLDGERIDNLDETSWSASAAARSATFSSSTTFCVHSRPWKMCCCL